MLKSKWHNTTQDPQSQKEYTDLYEIQFEQETAIQNWEITNN